MFRIVFLNFLVILIFNMANPIIPAMLTEKGSPDFLNGFLFATMSLGQLVFSPIVVTLYKKIKPRTFIIVGPFLYGLTQIGFAVFDSSILMLICRFISGMIVASVLVSFLIYTHNINYQNNRFNKYSLIFGANAIGAVIGLFIASIVSNYGIYTSFYLQPILGVFYAFLCIYILKGLSEPNVSKTKEKFVENFMVVFSSAQIFVIFLIMFLTTFSFMVLSSNINYFATETYNINMAQSSYVSMGIQFSVFLSNIVIVTVCKKFKLRKLLSIMTLYMLVCLSLMFYFDNIIFSVFVLGNFVLLINAYRPLLTDLLVSKMETDVAAKYLSATNSVVALGSISAGYITGLVYHYNPMNMFYLIYFLLFVVFILLLGRLYVYRR